MAALAVFAVIACCLVAMIPSSDATDSVDGSTIIGLDTDGDGVITLDKDYVVKSVITITSPLVINGNGHSITAGEDFSATGNTGSDSGKNSIISINSVAGAVVLNDIEFNSNSKASGINIDQSANVTLNNVTATGSTGAGLTVNNKSGAIVNDSEFSNNSWGDINVDKASNLTVDDATELTSNFQIWSEDAGNTTGGSTVNADGYVAYDWKKTADSTMTGKAYFKNGATAGDLSIGSEDTLTVKSGEYINVTGKLTVNGALANDGYVFAYGYDATKFPTGTGMNVVIPSGTTASVNGTSITVTGEPVVIDDFTATGEDLSGLFNTAVGDWAIIGFDGVEGSWTKITQTNAALPLAYPNEPNFTDKTKESTDVNLTLNAGEFNWFLVPYDGSSVKYEFQASDSTKNITLNFYFDIEVVKKATSVTDANKALDSDNKNVEKVVMDGSSLTDTTTPISVSAGKTLVVENMTGSTNFAVNTVDGEKTQSVEFKGVTGTVIVTKGSVQIFSPDMIKDGQVTVGADTTLRILDGTSLDGVKFVAEQVSGEYVTGAVVEVPRSATLTFANEITFEGVSANIKGTVNGGTIVAGAGSTVTIDGTVTSDFENAGGTIVNNSASMGTITLSDGTIVDNRTSVNGSISQDIIVTGDVTVVSGGSITVNGTLTVENGATITFEQGSKLNVGATGKVVIDGTINIEADDTNTAAIFTYGGSNMAVNGTLNLEGKLSFATVNGTGITVTGTVNVGEDATANFKDISVSAAGNLNIYGIVTGTAINNGTITVDSESESTFTIYMRDGATLNLVNAVGDFTVTDEGMTFRYNGDDKDIETINTLEFSDVAGVTVTETLTTENKKDPADSTKTIRLGYGNMYISGDADAASDLEDTVISGTIVVSAGKIQVAADASLSVAAPVKLTVNNTATFAVAGTVDVTDQDNDFSYSGTIDNLGTVDVTGKVTTKDKIATGTINAAHYSSGTGSAKVEVYTALATAIADGAKDIDLLGTIVISEDITIPAGVKVDASAITKMTIKDTATVTVAYDGNNSGKLINGSKVIDVDGTLVAQHLKKSGLTESNIDSDVATYSGDSATYTSIYNALANAQDGDVVEVTRDGPLTIEKDITIPVGVTLRVPESAVTVAEGVTVTVNGTYEGDSTYTMTPSSDENDPTQTIVNGMFKLLGTTDGLTSTVSGAYYAYDGYNVISPISVLATVIADVESDDAKVYGTVTEGDVSISAEEFTIQVQSGAVLTLSSLTLSGVTFDFTNGRTNATVNVADASFVLDKVRGGIISTVTTTENDVTTTTAVLTGNVTTADQLKSEKELPTGSISVSGTAQIGSATAAANFNKVVDAKETTTNKAPTFTVAAEANIDVASAEFNGKVTVNGTVTVTGTGIKFNEMVVVSGTITVDDDASATVANDKVLYVGVTKDSKNVISDLGSGNVSGVTVGVVYVSPNATFTATEAQTDDLVSTEYYVEDELLVTAYAENDNSTTISSVSASVDDARFDGWKNAQGTDAGTGTDAKTIGSTGFDKVYADIEYDIYVINLRADQNAVSSISIDGNIMQFGMINGNDGNWYYGYTATVAAGSHTISYELANGYSGTGILTVNGTQQSGLTFTTEGQPTETVGGETVKTYNLQLTGFEKSGYVPDTPDTPSTPSDSGDDGMTITDYLLIILVVLIIVMAIIVAMRLMRS